MQNLSFKICVKNKLTCLVLRLILVFIVPASICKGQIIVDGKLNDWNKSSFSFDSNNTLYYAIAKDVHNIYIAIKKDEKLIKVTASKTIGGIQLFINGQGERDTINALNIGYPVGSSGKLDFDQFFLNNVGDLKKPRLHSIYNDFGITVAVQATFDNEFLKTYSCEYRIPIESINPRGKEIWICFMLKGLRWKGKGPSPYGMGTIVSISKDLNKDDVYDAMDWSYTWIKVDLSKL
ncbi:hypothetical protein ACR782_04090 [Sphingobacterium spiritivorum]